MDRKNLKKFFDDKGLTQEKIAEMLGISQPLVSAYLNGKPFGKKVAKKWADTFGLSQEHLLLGTGSLLESEKDRIDNIVSNIIDKENIEIIKPKTFPLIPIEAVAGFGEDSDGIAYEDCEQYMVPDFEKRGMEFLIRVSGSSMYPKYSSGDVLACRKIRDILFFQWGKIYVIDSSQGQLVKRIFEDKDNPENIICVSDNKEKYPPFSMPKSDIRSLSIVIGVVRLE